jgi:hypothetical protein
MEAAWKSPDLPRRGANGQLGLKSGRGALRRQDTLSRPVVHKHGKFIGTMMNSSQTSGVRAFTERSDKMDAIPAFAGQAFWKKSSLQQTDSDQDRFPREK